MNRLAIPKIRIFFSSSLSPEHHDLQALLGHLKADIEAVVAVDRFGSRDLQKLEREDDEGGGGGGRPRRLLLQSLEMLLHMREIEVLSDAPSRRQGPDCGGKMKALLSKGLCKEVFLESLSPSLIRNGILRSTLEKTHFRSMHAKGVFTIEVFKGAFKGVFNGEVICTTIGTLGPDYGAKIFSFENSFRNFFDQRSF